MELISKEKALTLLDLVVEDTHKAYQEQRFVSYQEVATRCYRLINSLEPEMITEEVAQDE